MTHTDIASVASLGIQSQIRKPKLCGEVNAMIPQLMRQRRQSHLVEKRPSFWAGPILRQEVLSTWVSRGIQLTSGVLLALVLRRWLTMLLAVKLTDEKVWIAVGFCVLLRDAFVGRVTIKASLPKILPLGFCIIRCGQYDVPPPKNQGLSVLKTNCAIPPGF